MDPGAATPLLDFFRRGNVDRDVRLMVARRELGLREHEQRGLLELLLSDPDPEIARLAAEGLELAATDGAPSAAPEGQAEEPAPEGSAVQRIAAMSPGQRLALAMKGTREERAILVRDPNKIVAMAVLSSPKITDSEVESIAKMANVSDDVLRAIGQTRAWAKNYAVVSALTRNPKTPVPVSLNLLSRLHESEVKVLSTDRNVPDAIRIAARRRLAPK